MQDYFTRNARFAFGNAGGHSGHAGSSLSVFSAGCKGFWILAIFALTRRPFHIGIEGSTTHRSN
jgi:hypothetical protein